MSSSVRSNPATATIATSFGTHTNTRKKCVCRKVYTIGNNYSGEKRRVNGYCYREHIYGILVKTQRGEFCPERVEKHW